MRFTPQLVSSALIWVAVAQAQTAALVPSPNPSVFGQPVTLTATVSGAIGKVTFYDGVTVLGVSPVSSGQATLTTSLLPAGTRQLHACYATVTSAAVAQVVAPNPDAGFLAPSGYTTGAGPGALAAGDFNHDGKTDIVTANASDSTVSVLLGKGDGTFQTAVGYPLDRMPRAIAIGDFNEDGAQDIVIAGFGGISVLLGNGDGTFQAAVDYNTPGDPVGVTAGDFNLDGKPDVAVVTQNDSSIYVLLGNGDGTFASPVPYSLGGKGTSVAIGDVNGDGKPDLVATVADNVRNQVAVLRGAGDGTFQAPLYYAAGTAPHSLVLADLNGDGLVDAAVIDGNASVGILLGTASGDFSAPSTFTASNPAALAVSDLNADGKPDLVWAGGSLNTVNVAFGKGDGTFQTATPFQAGTNPVALAVTEVNGDGKPDVVVVNSGSNVNQIGILLGTSGLTVTVANTTAFVRGTNASFTITVTNGTANSIPGSVTIAIALPTPLAPLSISGPSWQCAGTTCARSDALTAGTSYSPITVTLALPADAPGLITVQTSLTSGNSVPLNITTVFAAPPLAPALTAPVNGALDVLEIPSLTWNAAAGAKSYDLNFGTSSTPPLQSNTQSTTAFPGILTGCTTYYWQVTARNEGGLAASTMWSFTTRPLLSLNPSPTTFGPAGGAGSVIVTDTPGCSWSVVSGASWITVTSSASSTNSGTVAYTVAPNVSAQRSATLTIGGRVLTITQATGCPVSFNSSLFADATSQSASIGVTADAGCTWATASNASWVTVKSATPLSGNGTVSIALSANLTNLQRIATVTIGSATLTVTQRLSVSTFADVTPDQPFFDPINVMSNMSITSGCSSSPPSYCPAGNVTRAQMAVFLVRSAVNGNFTYTAQPYFTDVPATHPFFKWIQKLRDLGITSGCSATTFCPDDTVTRGQMAVFLIRDRYGATTVFNYPTTPVFSDVPASQQFFNWIQKMAQVGITSGCTATEYCPDDPVTRGQMSVFILRSAFNLFLPANAPSIVSIVGSSLAAGASATLTITGQNTNFTTGVTQVQVGPGVTVSNVNVLNNTTLTAQFAVDANAASGPRAVIVTTGSEEAVLPNGFLVP